jgi:hypothetical protein
MILVMMIPPFDVFEIVCDLIAFNL